MDASLPLPEPNHETPQEQALATLVAQAARMARDAHRERGRWLCPLCGRGELHPAALQEHLTEDHRAALAERVASPTGVPVRGLQINAQCKIQRL